MTISGVIPAPYFNLLDQATIDDWSKRRMAPGLWADVRGRRLRFTIQSSGVRHLEASQIIPILEQWDEMVGHKATFSFRISLLCYIYNIY